MDYIVTQRFKIQIKDCSYPGAGINRDHNLVLMIYHLKFKDSRIVKGLLEAQSGKREV